MKKDIGPEQCRMARAALDWTTKQLSEAAGIGINTVTRFEKGEKETRQGTAKLLRIALEDGGVTFADNGCVCPPSSRKQE